MINYWEEDIYWNDDTNNISLEVEIELSNLTKKFFEADLHEDSKQVAVTVVGYIAKTLSGRTNFTDCKL